MLGLESAVLKGLGRGLVKKRAQRSLSLVESVGQPSVGATPPRPHSPYYSHLSTQLSAPEHSQMPKDRLPALQPWCPAQGMTEGTTPG